MNSYLYTKRRYNHGSLVSDLWDLAQKTTKCGAPFAVFRDMESCGDGARKFPNSKYIFYLNGSTYE